MEEHIGTLTILGTIASQVAEQVFGSWLHKGFMKLMVLLTAIGVTFAFWAAPIGGFEALRAFTWPMVLAYGGLAFVFSLGGREALKGIAPGLVKPSVRVGDVVGATIERVTSNGNRVLASDTIPVGTYLRDPKARLLMKVTAANPDGTLSVAVEGSGMILTVPRSGLRWLNPPKR